MPVQESWMQGHVSGVIHARLRRATAGHDGVPPELFEAGQRIPYPCWVRNFIYVGTLSQGPGGQAALEKNAIKSAPRRAHHEAPRPALYLDRRLTIRRRKNGDGYTFVSARGRTSQRDHARALEAPRGAARLRRGALCRRSAGAHPGDRRDAAGRLQYRYHPDWEKVRERRKARRCSASSRRCRASAAR